MHYYEAIQIGQERAKKSQYRLFEYTGFAFLLKTVKRTSDGFKPVGEEDLVKMEQVGDLYIICICDYDGYTKAQSKPMEYEKAKSIYERMIKDGLKEYTVR